MDPLWIPVYLVLVGLAIVQAALVGLQTWEHRRFARSRLRDLPWCRASGRAVLFVPCRGGDIGLERNLEHLYLQDYHNYEIHFIVEGPHDPAWPVIQRVAARHPRVVTRVVFAGQAHQSGQKVHNLRVATSQLDAEVEYLAFVDADARPANGWLRALLARLDLPDAGAVTGYRWFVPQKPSLANLLLYSINCSVAALFGRNAPNCVWGGSWAIRRDTFERTGLAEAWNGTLSDDLVASRVIRRTGHRVEFEPAAVVQSPLDYSFPEMLSFLRRQYLIGRFYSPRLWAFGVVMTTFANAVLFGSLAAAVWGLLANRGGAAWFWLPAAGFGLLYAANVFRAAVRQDSARIYFPQFLQLDTLRLARRFDVWAGPLCGLVDWLGLVSASVGRHLTWRGITYRLYRGGQVRVVSREDHDHPADGARRAAPDETLPLEEPLAADAVAQPPVRYRKAG